MNKQVIEYVNINLGFFGTNIRTLRNPLLSWGRPRVRIIGSMFHSQSVPSIQATYLMKEVYSMEFSNHSRSYFA